MEYKNFSLALARQAGAIIKTNFSLGMKKNWKADETPVTATDLAINQLVIDSVRANFPEHSVLSEEGSHLLAGSQYTWVCDPVDGTIPFSHGVPTCVFSLALCRDGLPIAGVTYDPFMDRMLWAEKGKGTWLNDKQVHVSQQKTFEKSVFGTCIWKGSDAVADISFLPEKIEAAGSILINVCSIVYMGSLVASGEFLGTVFVGPYAHDTAALKIIVEEAGGKVTDLFGNDQRYDGPVKGHIIANPVIHEKILQMLR